MVNEMLVVFLGGLTFSCLHLCSARCECEVVTVVCVHCIRMKSMLMHKFVLDALATTGPDTFPVILKN